MKLLVAVLIMSFTSIAIAKSEIIYPLGRKGVEAYLKHISNADPESLGFNPKIARIENENKEGSAMLVSGSQSIWVYDEDINNDGKNEYMAIYVFGGSLSTSGILSVMPKEGMLYNHAVIISKNLWNDDSGDLSKFHSWLAAPSVIKRDGKVYIRYMDKKPKTLFTEYIWEKESFKKVKELSSNTF